METCILHYTHTGKHTYKTFRIHRKKKFVADFYVCNEKGRHERKWKTKQNLLLYRCDIEVVRNPKSKEEILLFIIIMHVSIGLNYSRVTLNIFSSRTGNNYKKKPFKFRELLP